MGQDTFFGVFSQRVLLKAAGFFGQQEKSLGPINIYLCVYNVGEGCIHVILRGAEMFISV